MFYLNSFAFGLYHALKEIDPTNNALKTIKLDAFSVDEPCFIKQDSLLPILFALNEQGFYQRYELKWLVKEINSLFAEEQSLSNITRDSLGCVSRSYICNAPTLGDFIARTIEFFMFSNRAMSFDINAQTDHVQIKFCFNNKEQIFNSGYGPLFGIAYSSQLFFGTDVKIDSFFADENKLDLETYQAHIAGKVNFAKESYLSFKKDDFKIVNKYHNRHIDNELKSILERLRPSEPDFENIIEDVLTKINQLFIETNDHISADEMASLFNMSKSTLYRKLEAVNTSYRELVEVSRKELALKFIKEGAISFSEVSDRLGYANLTGFNRAFKRWLDVSPSEYRRNLYQIH